MKLLLTSNSFNTPDLIQAASGLCGKPAEAISVAVINEAYALERGDKRWVLDNLNAAANSFGGEFDLINLLALPLDQVAELCSSKDLIFVPGGDPDYLMSVFLETGFDTLLPSLLEDKVYVGSSAGAMVAARRMPEDVIRDMYDVEPYGEIDSYLNYVNVAVLPHMGSAGFTKATEDAVDSLPALDFPVFGISDESAVVMDGDEVYTVGPSVVTKPASN